MKKIGIGLIIVILSIMTFILGFGYRKNEVPNEFYQVYLDDELIGTIKSKDELTNYIETQGNIIRKTVEDYKFLLDYNCKTDMTTEEKNQYNNILSEFRKKYSSELKLLDKENIINTIGTTGSIDCVNGTLTENEKYLDTEVCLIG